MITGFRWQLEGAQSYYGVDPDLSTFGKGMANGFSVAALVGRREIMEVGSISTKGQERTFLLSTTHGGEMCGLAAFLEAVSIYREEKVCEHLWDYGRKFKQGFDELIERKGLRDFFSLEGPDICLNYVTRNGNGDISPEFRTLVSQEFVNKGVMMPWIAISHAHGARELDITLDALEHVLEVYAQALNGDVKEFLLGDPVQPVFRQYN